MNLPTSPARTSRSALARLLGAASLAIALVAVPSAATAQEGDDPNLDQTIEGGQPVVRGERTLAAGHVDMGPRFVDGEWSFLIHDDVAKGDANASSVWRHPQETVFHIVDAGRLTAPDDPAYGFLGAEPGAGVWVSPQTQNPDVVWIGWNTQDPEVMGEIDRGVTLTLRRVQGPGVMTVFLQSGSFGEPDVLWDSRSADAQPLWVDVNTHTHANWAFTEPGVYLVELEASADLIDGSTVSDVETIRVAVGTDTPPSDALAASWGGDAVAPDEASDGAAGERDGADADTAPGAVPADAGEDADPLVPILIAAIGVVAAGLILGVIVVAVRSSRSRREALSASTTRAPIAEDAE